MKARFCRALPLTIALLGAIAGVSTVPALADYRTHPQAKAFIDRMAEDHGFERSAVAELLGEARRQQSIIDAISRPAEKAKPWHEYRAIFIQEDRIAQGVAFWRRHGQTLARAEAEYGVDPAVIVAIIGVETRYGRNAGSYRVLDALATLGFDYPPRSDFFREQLVEFLVLARETGLPLREVKGSYAGAMGYGQFIPSSWRSFAVDFSGDGRIDIINDVTDAIGSVANYLKVHGWQHRHPAVVAARVQSKDPAALVAKGLELERTVADYQRAGVETPDGLGSAERAALYRFAGDRGEEYWLGLTNFYVITRYNRSPMYALAVLQLSEAIAARRPA